MASSSPAIPVIRSTAAQVLQMPAAAPSKRQPELDAMRGVFLLWMTLTHLPTHANEYANQPFGFVSAAEGFVFLSAMLTGKLHARMAGEETFARLRAALFSRARRVYLYHLCLVIFAFTVGAMLAVHGSTELRNLLSFYFAHPLTAGVCAVLLVYCPPLLDILPMYVVYLLLTPFVLRLAKRVGWVLVLSGSAVVWLAAQFGLRAHLYLWLGGIIHHRIPVNEMGAFDMWAWQFLWMGGLYLGVRVAEDTSLVDRLPRWTVWTACAVALAGLSLRHGWPTSSIWSGRLTAVQDKWSLAPVRIVNFAALTLLVASVMPMVKRVLAWKPLAAVGMSSIQVFSAHVVCVFLALAMVRDTDHMLHGGLAWLAVVGTYAVMIATGLAATSNKLRERQQRRAESRGRVLLPAEAQRL